MARARGGAQRTLLASLGDGVSCCYLLRFLSLFTLLACPAWAARWDVVPSVSFAETFTDNIFLAEDTAKESDWVTQVIPGIRIDATGARLKFNLNYAPEAVYYSRGQKENQIFQRGNAVATAELAKQLLFLEAGAKVDQYDVSLEGPLTTSNVNITGNRATATTFFVSPYLLRDFGSAVRGEVRYTYSVWNTDDPTILSDNDANRVNVRLASGPAFRRLTWNLAYNREDIKYETDQETLTEVSTANARLLITPTVGVLAQGGYESYDSGIPGSISDGPRWSAGLEWTPTLRTRLAGTAGRRFFGDTYSFDFRHRTRLTTWSASYNDDVTTARDEFFIPATSNTAGSLDQLFLSKIPDPVARQKAVEDFIARTGLPPSLSEPVNFFSDQIFLVKRWLASAGILGVRNTLVFNAFKETRDVLFAGIVRPGFGDFAASNTIRQTGAGLAWNWRVTPWTTWNLGGSYGRNEFLDSDRVDHL
ncbi:MAG TPA: TIGR03016 family PEP-CTERM system-associated outer membrane protein, partial [Nitrospiraceae bacterium]